MKYYEIKATLRPDAKGRMINPFICSSDELARELLTHCNWFSGVPDSMFRNLLPKIENYFPASRENHGLAMAFGARLGGKKPCVMLQNSGLGLLGDTLYGLFDLYGLGLVFVVTWRGELEWEERQHKRWGERTPQFLEVLGIETFDLQTQGLKAVASAAAHAFHKNLPAAVLIRRGNIDE